MKRAPQYDYVSPPPDQAPYNIQPTSGAGDAGPSGGAAATRDQPIAQAGMCITADATLSGRAQVSLLIPPTQPFPTAMYYAPSLSGPWTSIGGSVDLNTYLMSASASRFGCSAVRYSTPSQQPGPGLRGALLPLAVAILIAVVLLAGLPVAIRRRYNRR